MDLEQRLRASLVALDPGPTFTARVMARVGRGAGRRRSSFILIGTVLVVGAAAAMLAWQMSAVPPPPVEGTAIPAATGSAPVVERPTQAMQDAGESVAAASEPVAPKPAAAMDGSPQYSVLVLPLRQEAVASRRGPVEVFYAAVLDELRKVPGLTLRLQGGSEREAGGQADYVLAITSLAARAQQSGGVVVLSTDNRTAYRYVSGMSVVSGSDGGGTAGMDSSFDPEGSVFVEMKVESRQSAATRDALLAGAPGAGSSYGSGAMAGVANLVLNNRLTGFNVDMDYGSSAVGDGGSARVSAQPASNLKVLPLRVLLPDAVYQQRCSISNAVRPPECMTPAQLAANQVEALRLQVFPPDAAFQQRVVAQLSDIHVDQSGELRVLEDLLQKLVGEGGSRLDAGTIHALVGYAARQPAGPRLYIWSRLRQVAHPALVAPLVEALRRDRDQRVRLAALANLEANYSTDPQVRSAFESIDREETDASVRVAVRRALYGQAQWRDEILSALHSTNQPYEARLAPLLVLGPEVSPHQQAQRRAALHDQQVLRPLMTVVREHLRDADHAGATSDVLGLLGSVDDPAVFELFMQLMRDTSLLDQEISMRGDTLDMSGPITSWVASHRNDPRVIASLRDADPRLRTTIPQMGKPEQVTVPLTLEEQTFIPANLLQRMREVTEQPAPPAPLTR